MTLLIVGGRNRLDGEFTTLGGTPADFTDDTWTTTSLDPVGTIWAFPDAFRVQNDMIIVINQHSAQAFLHD